jgi:DNA processing protein
MDVRTAVALSLLEGTTRSRAAALLREVTAERPALLPHAIVGAMLARLGLPAESFSAADARAVAALGLARRSGIEPIVWRDPRYPALVAEIHDPPPVLWVRGQAAPLSALAVAVVGARRASAAALEAARMLGAGLAERGVVVVSGLARGVDSAAHRGAIEAGGLTVGVLGSGPDVVYPAEHAELAAVMAVRGAVVSEQPPGAPPLPEHFPLRNRIISGLSRAVVVVEAAERSGSLITARSAAEQGRDVMAMPGLALSGRNSGAHALIRDGAKLVETVDDILEELPWFARPDPAVVDDCKLLKNSELIEAMPVGEPCSLDELAGRTGRDPGGLLARLLEMELDGWVSRGPGGRFVRSARRMVG